MVIFMSRVSRKMENEGEPPVVVDHGRANFSSSALVIEYPSSAELLSACVCFTK